MPLTDILLLSPLGSFSLVSTMANFPPVFWQISYRRFRLLSFTSFIYTKRPEISAKCGPAFRKVSLFSLRFLYCFKPDEIWHARSIYAMFKAQLSLFSAKAYLAIAQSISRYSFWAETLPKFLWHFKKKTGQFLAGRFKVN